MDGIRGLLPGREMATRVAANGGTKRQTVVFVGVAQIAGHIRMAVGQRKAGRTVVENARGPRCNRMACCACRCRGRETGCDVIRYCTADCRGALEGCLVATVTIR